MYQPVSTFLLLLLLLLLLLFLPGPTLTSGQGIPYRLALLTYCGRAVHTRARFLSLSLSLSLSPQPGIRTSSDKTPAPTSQVSPPTLSYCMRTYLPTLPRRYVPRCSALLRSALLCSLCPVLAVTSKPQPAGFGTACWHVSNPSLRHPCLFVDSLPCCPPLPLCPLPSSHPGDSPSHGGYRDGWLELARGGSEG
ncbi:hypothetical protein LX36DRAFT_372908 [Colletotrichum falcatum]|nr:hypothetical protein LX36DRAFT_372908 [Colletotrichum falcatum]